MQIALIDARTSAMDRTWLTNVYPLYLHDLSEFDEEYYRLTDHGLWEPDHLPSWLDEQDDWPLLITADSQRIGFALVNQAPSPYITPGRDYRMSEFFILRRYGPYATLSFRAGWASGHVAVVLPNRAILLLPSDGTHSRFLVE